jgi:hypothetical protein
MSFTNSFQTSSFDFANALAAAQLNQLNVTRQRSSLNQGLAQNQFYNTIQQGNEYFAIQSATQTTYLKALGDQYAIAANKFADAAKTASKKIGRGGLLGLLGF